MNSVVLIEITRNKTHEQERYRNATPENPTPSEKEIGGLQGPDPTRYGDWEVNGRCTDF